MGTQSDEVSLQVNFYRSFSETVSAFEALGAEITTEPYLRFDATSYSESINLAFGKTLSDTGSASDSLRFDQTSVRLDTAATADFITVAFTKFVSDSLAVVETLTTAVDKLLTDSTSSSEAISALIQDYFDGDYFIATDVYTGTLITLA